MHQVALAFSLLYEYGKIKGSKIRHRQVHHALLGALRAVGETLKAGAAPRGELERALERHLSKLQGRATEQ